MLKFHVIQCLIILCKVSIKDSKFLTTIRDRVDGGQVLRHYKDGRAVDVHGWQFSDGGNMGCENSVHADCKGCSYILHVHDDCAGDVEPEVLAAGAEKVDD